MLQEAKNLVCRTVSKVNQYKTGLTALLVAAIMSVPYLASAQSNDITLEVPDINYGGIASQLMGYLVPVVLAAIGVGLSIWIVCLLYRLFRSLGK